MTSSIYAASSPARSIYRVFPFLFANVFSYYLTLALDVDVTRFFICRITADDRALPSDDVCHSPQVLASTAALLSTVTVLYQVLDVLLTSLLQQWSDRYGRRPFLVALPVFSVLAKLVLLTSITVDAKALRWTCIFGYSLLKVVGDKSNYLSRFYITDLTDAETRSSWFSRYFATYFLATACGSVGGSLISSTIKGSFFPPYVLAIAIYSVMLLWSVVVLSETRPVVVRDPVSDGKGTLTGWKKILGWLTTPLRPLRVILPVRVQTDKGEKRDWTMVLLASNLFIFNLSGPNTYLVTLSFLYTSILFGWTGKENGLILAAMTILQVLFLAVVFPLLLKRGRQAYKIRATVRSDTRAEESLVATPAESSGGGERAPLLARSPESDEDVVEAAVQDKGKEASNHFDIIVLGVSNLLEALSWSGIAVASNWQVLLGALAVKACASGYGPSMSASLVGFSSFSPTEALAAEDLIRCASAIFAPLIWGSLFTWLTKIGQPRMLYLVLSIVCGSTTFLLLLIKNKTG